MLNSSSGVKVTRRIKRTSSANPQEIALPARAKTRLVQKPKETVEPFVIPTPLSIIIGTLLISAAILLSNNGPRVESLSGQTAAAPLVTPQPSPSGPVIVQGVTTGDMPVLGNKDAKVTVVEFADYQCPFCEQVYKQVWPQLKKDYVDAGKVKFAYRDYAFLGKPQSDPAGDESTNASNAARCANDQGEFWQYHDYLFEHQGQEDSGAFSKDKLKQYADDLGLNTAQFDQCMDNDAHVKEVTADMQAGNNYRVQSTPTIFVNGLEIVGAQPYSAFKSAIDQALTGSTLSPQG